MTSYEMSFRLSDGPLCRVPRLFADFDEAWDVARKVIDVYKRDDDSQITITFRKSDS